MFKFQKLLNLTYYLKTIYGRLVSGSNIDLIKKLIKKLKNYNVNKTQKYWKLHVMMVHS